MTEAIPVGLDIPKPIFTGQSVGQMEGAFWGALLAGSVVSGRGMGESSFNCKSLISTRRMDKEGEGAER